MALEFIREIIDSTESRPALLHPMRVGSAMRCQVSPGKVAGAGWAPAVAAARRVARRTNRVRRIGQTARWFVRRQGEAQQDRELIVCYSVHQSERLPDPDPPDGGPAAPG